MRTLVIIPIIHTEQDMGSLLSEIKREYVSRYGLAQWDSHLNSIAEIWDGIRRMILDFDLPYASVRLFQDGLPLCGKEAEIVRDVAARGSKNHQLLAELAGRGARLMGTEDPQLLLQEYQFLQGALRDMQSEEGEQRWKQQSQRLLADRDQFIAARINDTLLPNEIGLLFLGMAHQIEPMLSSDILVRHLLPAQAQGFSEKAN